MSSIINPFISFGGIPAASLLPSLVSDADAFFAASVAVGSVTLVPSLYSGTDAFHSPTVGGGVASFRLLEDGTSKRLLEDGTSKRTLE